MHNSHFVVNIGNSHTTAARAEQGRLCGEVLKLPTAEVAAAQGEHPRLRPFLQNSCLIACVVPDLQARIMAAFPQARFLTAAMVDPKVVDFSPVDARTVGADRVANAVGALELHSPPLVVIDCGTAITIEAVDRHRRFVGGAILPGRRLQRRALRMYTGQLPEVELQENLPTVPGIDTKSAIRAGVDLGIAGALSGLVDAMVSRPDWRDAELLLAGGDCEFFAKLLPAARAVGECLTLRGLACLSGTASLI